MSIIEVAVWAVAGAIGAVVASLTIRNRENKLAFTAVAVVTTFLLTALMVPPAKRWYYTRETDKALDRLILYRAVKTAEPDTYERIRVSLRDGMINRRPIEALIDENSAHIGAILPKYVRKTTDSAAVGFVAAFNVALGELMGAGGDECYYWMYPQKGKGVSGAVRKMSAATKSQLESAMGNVIIDAVEKPQGEPDQEAGDRAISEVVKRMQGRGEAEGLLLVEKTDPTSEERQKICRSSQVFFAELLKLPEAERGNAIRHNFTGQ